MLRQPHLIEEKHRDRVDALLLLVRAGLIELQKERRRKGGGKTPYVSIYG